MKHAYIIVSTKKYTYDNQLYINCIVPRLSSKMI